MLESPRVAGGFVSGGVGRGRYSCSSPASETGIPLRGSYAKCVASQPLHSEWRREKERVNYIGNCGCQGSGLFPGHSTSFSYAGEEEEGGGRKSDNRHFTVSPGERRRHVTITDCTPSSLEFNVCLLTSLLRV